MIETNKLPGYYLVLYGMITLPVQGERRITALKWRGDEMQLIMTDRHQGHSALPYRPAPSYFIHKNRACGNSGQLFCKRLRTPVVEYSIEYKLKRICESLYFHTFLKKNTIYTTSQLQWNWGLHFVCICLGHQLINYYCILTRSIISS